MAALVVGALLIAFFVLFIWNCEKEYERILKEWGEWEEDEEK